MDHERLYPEVIPPRRPRRALALVGVAALLATAGATNFVLSAKRARGCSTKKMPAASTVVRRDVLVELDSSPRGARVASPIAGTCITPCTLAVPVGSHTFRFTRDGKQRDYAMDVDQNKRVWVSLTEAGE